MAWFIKLTFIKLSFSTSTTFKSTTNELQKSNLINDQSVHEQLVTYTFWKNREHKWLSRQVSNPAIPAEAVHL